MSVVRGEDFNVDCIFNKRPKTRNFECLVKRRGLSSKEEEKESILCKHGQRPGRPRKIVKLVPEATESICSVSSPDDDISDKMVKPDYQTCASYPISHNKAQTLVAREEPVKTKPQRKSVPPELQAKNLLKPPKALPRKPKSAIKKPVLPERLNHSSRDLAMLRGPFSSGSGQGNDASQAPTRSPSGRQTTKKRKELPVELKELKSSVAEMGENVSESTISRSLHKAGLNCTVQLIPVTTKSSSTVSSLDEDISAKMVKPDCQTCVSHLVSQNNSQTVVPKEEPLKKKCGRKALPLELKSKKLLKTPKALPRRPKPAIKKPILPERTTRSSRDLVGALSGHSSSSSGQGQGAPQAATESQNRPHKSKKSKELSVELRDKIVKRHLSGEGYKKISKSLNISSSTIRSIILKWKVHRTTETLPRSGCPSKLSSQARNRLVSEATMRPTVTLKELKSSIAEMGENVSESTISRSLHKAGLYCKVAKRNVRNKGGCLMQSLQGVSSSQHHPNSEVLWWEHYVKDLLLSQRNNEDSQDWG